MKKLLCFSTFYLLLPTAFLFQMQVSALDIVGSSTMAPIVKKLGEDFSLQEKEKITVNGNGSDFGIKHALAGNLGIVSRELKVEEKNQGLETIPVAYIVDALIVNRSNKIKNLTLEQAGEIFAGEVKDWSELGGSKSSIQTVGPSQNHGTYASFVDFLMIISTAKNYIGLDSIKDVVTKVEQTPNSIAYVPLNALNGKQKVNKLKLNEIVASRENVLKKLYPLSRKLSFVYSKKNLTPGMQKFIDFFLTPKALVTIEKEGLIPIKKS